MFGTWVFSWNENSQAVLVWSPIKVIHYRAPFKFLTVEGLHVSEWTQKVQLILLKSLEMTHNGN